MKQILRLLFPYFQFTELSIAATIFIALVFPQIIVDIDSRLLTDIADLLLLEASYCFYGVIFTIFTRRKLWKDVESRRTLFYTLLVITLFYIYFIFVQLGGIVTTFIWIVFSRTIGVLSEKVDFQEDMLKAFFRIPTYLVSLAFAGLIFTYGEAPEISGIYIGKTNLSNNSGLELLEILNWGFWFYLLNGLFAIWVITPHGQRFFRKRREFTTTR